MVQGAKLILLLLKYAVLFFSLNRTRLLSPRPIPQPFFLMTALSEPIRHSPPRQQLTQLINLASRTD